MDALKPLTEKLAMPGGHHRIATEVAHED